MKIYKIIFVILFFIIILLPICFMNFKVDQISEIDNSKLPEFKDVKNAITLENYISKRVGFRTEIINSYTKLNDVLFNKMIHPSYTYGKEGYVFFKTNIERHDDKYLDNFASLVKNMQDYVTTRGSYFLFIINPTKISVYSQYLPKGYNFTNYRITYLKNKLDELNVNYIDNTEYLKEKSLTHQVYNKKYDAGHWNDIGALYAMNNVYTKMKNDGIDIENLSEDNYNLTYEVKNTLPVSEFKIHEKVPVYNLKNQTYSIKNKYKSAIEIHNIYSNYVETINPANNNSLMFFKGSYLNGREKFVANQFGESYFIHNYYNSINFDYYYNIANPKIVLFETVEYAINEQYYPNSSIIKKQYNELYNKYKNLNEDKLIDVNKDEIINEINKNYSSKVPLTKIVLPKENYQYAYLKIDNKIYDFCHEKSTCYISLDTELLYNSSIDIIIVSSELQKKQIIEIK